MASLATLVQPTKLVKPLSSSVPGHKQGAAQNVNACFLASYKTLRTNAKVRGPQGTVLPSPTSAKSAWRSLSSSFKGVALAQQATAPSKQSKCSRGGALGSQCNIQWGSPEGLNWILLVASIFLMLAAKTPLYKQLLVPLLALHMPHELVSFIKGEYGLWTAFLAVMVRLFYGIPAQLELPFAAFLAVLAAPSQILDFRRSPAAGLVGLVLGSYVAWTHFRTTRDVDGSLNSSVLATTIATIVVVLVPIVFAVKGYTS